MTARPGNPSTMSDNSAEQLDGDVLGEQPGDDSMPGVGDYPPDQALGVNDPNLVADDDVAMREARTVADLTIDSPDGDLAGPDPAAGDLLPPDGDTGDRDDVQQLLGSTTDDDEVTTPPAEVQAIHITEDT